MEKKQKMSLLLIAIIIGGTMAGTLFYVFSDRNVTIIGQIVATRHPPVLEEIPFNFTYAVLDKETENMYYMVYENKTMINQFDSNYMELIGEVAVVKGILMYAQNIEKTEEYRVIVVKSIELYTGE